MNDNPYREGNFEKIGDSIVRKRLPTPEEVLELKRLWLERHKARMKEITLAMEASTNSPEDGLPADQRAGMLGELLYYFEGQIRKRQKDFLDRVDAGDCLDFKLVDAGMQGTNELPTPSGAKCNDVFDPDGLGLPGFDPEECTLSEWFEYMAAVADHWRAEVYTLVEQIEALQQ